MEYKESDIQILTPVEAIRRRPSMYIGPLDDPILLNRLIQEVLCVSVDEAVSGHCTEIRVAVQPGGPVTVRNNGRGLPMAPTSDGRPLAEKLLTDVYACREHKQNSVVNSLSCDASMVVVNVLSEWQVVKNYRDGVCWAQEYRRGAPLAPFRRESETIETGLEIAFQPDMTIFGALSFDAQELANWLTSVGLRFDSMNVSQEDTSAGKSIRQTFGGIAPAPATEV